MDEVTSASTEQARHAAQRYDLRLQSGHSWDHSRDRGKNPRLMSGRASLCNHVSCICLISRRLRTVVRAFLDI